MKPPGFCSTAARKAQAQDSQDHGVGRAGEPPAVGQQVAGARRLRRPQQYARRHVNAEGRLRQKARYQPGAPREVQCVQHLRVIGAPE